MQKTLQVRILTRYMSEKGLADFIEEYKENRQRGRTAKKPNDVDKRIHATFKKTQSMSETAKSFKISVSKVAGSVSRVVAWEK